MLHPICPEGITATPPPPEALAAAMETGEILRAMCVKCDELHNLHLDLGTQKGIIAREEAALGIRENQAREISILSRVGKSVSFQVLGLRHDGTWICSRRAAQLEARSYFLSVLKPGDILPAVVQNASHMGVFCDIGGGYSALMRIHRCCISRLEDASELFSPGQSIRAAILAVDDSRGQIVLTGRELLGTWEENAERFRQGQAVTGIVRSVMPYGVFVELTPNLSGLAEPTPGIEPGDAVSVFLRAILPEKHKIKLNILEKLPAAQKSKPEYFITSGHIRRWEYYPGSKAVTYF